MASAYPGQSPGMAGAYPPGGYAREAGQPRLRGVPRTRYQDSPPEDLRQPGPGPDPRTYSSPVTSQRYQSGPGKPVETDEFHQGLDMITENLLSVERRLMETASKQASVMLKHVTQRMAAMETTLKISQEEVTRVRAQNIAIKNAISKLADNHSATLDIMSRENTTGPLKMTHEVGVGSTPHATPRVNVPSLRLGEIRSNGASGNVSREWSIEGYEHQIGNIHREWSNERRAGGAGMMAGHAGGNGSQALEATMENDPGWGRSAPAALHPGMGMQTGMDMQTDMGMQTDVRSDPQGGLNPMGRAGPSEQQGLMASNEAVPPVREEPPLASQAPEGTPADNLDETSVALSKEGRPAHGVGRSDRQHHSWTKNAGRMGARAMSVGNVMDFVYEGALDFRGAVLKTLYGTVDWWLHLVEPKRTGALANFIGAGKFEMVSLLCVVLNCSYIIYEQNATLKTMDRDSIWWGQYVENFFTLFFLVELIMRLMVHRGYFFCNGEMGWNVVDFFIVGISTLQALQGLLGDAFSLQLSFLRTFRVMKLARVLRLLRMVKVFSDLRIMVIAFLNSCLALFWCMVLLGFTISMFALVFVQMVGEYLIENHKTYTCDPDADGCIFEDLLREFGSVQRSMLSLYMATTGGNDWSYYYWLVSETGDTAAFIFIFYTAFYYFGLFNLLTGMFVDKAVRASQPDQDMVIFEQRLAETEYVSAFMKIFNQFDVDHDGMISESEYKQVVQSDKCRIFLGLLGLQPSDTRIVFEALSHVQATVPVTEFVQGCMRMRGAATSIDMHSVQFEIQHIHLLLEDVHHDLREFCKGNSAQGSASAVHRVQV